MIRRPRKRGPGHPPLGKLARSVIVQARVTPAEHAAIAAGAKAAGETVSDYCRRRILGAPAHRQNPDE